MIHVNRLLACAAAIIFCAACTSQSIENDSVETDVIKLSSEKLFVPEEGGSYEILLTAKKDWTAGEVIMDGGQLSDWVKVDKLSGTPGESEIILTVNGMTSTKPRSATFLFSADDRHGTVLTVKQEKFEIVDISMSGSAPAADKPMENVLHVFYRGCTSERTRKVTLSASNGNVSLNKSEYTVDFPYGGGSTDIYIEGSGVKVGKETLTVKVDGFPSEQFEFKVSGYMKIKDFIESYYPEIPSEGSLAAVNVPIDEDILIKGIVISNSMIPEGEKNTRPLPNDQIIIQDSKEPNSGLWLKTQPKKTHNIPMGAEIEINLKGYEMGFDGNGRRFIRNNSSIPNEECIVVFDDKNPDNVYRYMNEMTAAEFVGCSKDYESMYIQIRNVKISQKASGMTFYNGKSTYGGIPVETEYGILQMYSYKTAPWKNETVSRYDIPVLRGIGLSPVVGVSEEESALLLQRREDFIMQ